MSAQTWFLIAIIGFALSGVTFVAALFMFIKMNIPSIIGDLSGKKVAREVKAMREQNSANSEKLSKTGKTDRGPLGGRIVRDSNVLKKVHASKRLDEKTDEIGMTPTEELSTATEVLGGSEATAVLGDTNATELLTSDATELLSGGTADLGGTTLLNPIEQVGQITEPVQFIVVRSEVLIHTSEVIE